MASNIEELRHQAEVYSSLKIDSDSAAYQGKATTLQELQTKLAKYEQDLQTYEQAQAELERAQSKQASYKAAHSDLSNDSTYQDLCSQVVTAQSKLQQLSGAYLTATGNLSTTIAQIKNILSAGDQAKAETLSNVKEYGIGMAFALLQMKIGVSHQSSAKSQLEEVKKMQAVCTTISEALTNCRNFKTSGSDKDKDKVVSLINQVNTQLKGIKQEGNISNTVTKDSVDQLINSLASWQSDLNNQVSTKMVTLQDESSKYSTYLSGSNSSMNSSLETLSKIIAAL